MRDEWLRRFGVLVAGLLAVAVVAGCAKKVGGTALADPEATSTSNAPAAPAKHGTAQELLGDFTTIDPCSLVDLQVFRSFGTPSLGDPGSLDECLVEVKTGAKQPLSVYIGTLDRTATYSELPGKPNREVADGVKVADYDTSNSFCNQLVVFADDITLSVNAYPYEGDEPKLCEIVQAGTGAAVDAIKSGKVKHRDFAPNSLGRVDPCAVAPGTVTTSVPGLSSIKPKAYPGKHNCLWASPDSVNGARLRVMFTATKPPVAQGTATESTISGRKTITTPGVDSGPSKYCFVEAPHIPFQQDGVSGLYEEAYVSVRLPKAQADQACKAATAVADAVWPHLPVP
jgi:hypothetical protein